MYIYTYIHKQGTPCCTHGESNPHNPSPLRPAPTNPLRRCCRQAGPSSTERNNPANGRHV